MLNGELEAEEPRAVGGRSRHSDARRLSEAQQGRCSLLPIRQGSWICSPGVWPAKAVNHIIRLPNISGSP